MREYRRDESECFNYLIFVIEDIELSFHIIQHALLTKKNDISYAHFYFSSPSDTVYTST